MLIYLNLFMEKQKIFRKLKLDIKIIKLKMLCETCKSLFINKMLSFV